MKIPHKTSPRSTGSTKTPLKVETSYKATDSLKSPQNELFDYLIGIDPGTNTGFAVWSVEYQCFSRVNSVLIHQAQFDVRVLKSDHKVKIYIEDSRNVSRAYAGAAKAQGAGSIKRDCNIWEDYLTDLNIPYQFIRPNKRSMLKMDAESFKKLTGYKERTNSHGRDAAMLVFGRTQ